MLEVIPDRLWLGNFSQLRDARSLFDLQIKAVVDLAHEELPAQLPREISYLRFPLIDGGGNSPELIDLE